VVFEDIDNGLQSDGSDQGSMCGLQKEATKLAELERELQITRESHQTTIEELESSNEELKSTNEEIQSSNEELQSTNEELESSKEELQSLNEELQTVNAELQSKVEELSAARDDMRNLLNSTAIATIFVDNAMRVRRFTTEAEKIVNLIHSDVGRPLRHVVSNLTYGDMIDDLSQVLKTLVPKSAEVRTIDGKWFNMRIVPYRTMDNRIDGAVLTFIDIAMQKQDLFKMSKVFSDGTDPIIIEDLSGNITEMNDEAVRLYGWPRQELIGKPILTIVPDERHDQAKDLLQRCKRNESVRNVKGLRKNKKGDIVNVLITLSLLKDDRGRPFGIATFTKHIDTA
jgi:two-component system CheB/CheR fusion protein